MLFNFFTDFYIFDSMLKVIFYRDSITNHDVCWLNLVGVSKAAHTRHDAEYVVIGGVYAYLGISVTGDSGGGEGKLKGSVVDAGHVACSGRLVFLGLEAEGVYVDSCGRDVGVVLVRLYQVEVTSHALGETIVAIELELGREDGVESRIALGEGKYESTAILVAAGEVSGGEKVVTSGKAEERYCGVAESTSVGALGGAGLPCGINGVGVIEPLLALVAGHGCSVDKLILLYNPDEFLARVVEVELDLVADRRYGFVAGELYLLDEVLVRDLGETAALVGVEVDVVYIERGGFERWGGYTTLRPVAVAGRAEFKVDLDLVVLEGNEGEGKSRVAAEPEFKRNVKVHFGYKGTIRTGGCYLGKAGYVSNHVGVSEFVARSLREFVPDVHPVTVVFVDALAANFYLSVLDEDVAKPVEPTELLSR